MKTWNIRKAAVICVCVLALLGTGITAYAMTGGTIFGWKNNAEVTIVDGAATTVLHTDSLTEPVAFEDGKMFFIVNGEHIDISDQVSTQEPFQYRYTDVEGIEHLWLIGLNDENEPEHYGYAEFMLENGEMVGGYSARVDILPDGSAMPWLDNHKPF